MYRVAAHVQKLIYARPAATWLRRPAQRIIQNDTNLGQETMEDTESHSIETSHPGPLGLN